MILWFGKNKKKEELKAAGKAIGTEEDAASATDTQASETPRIEPTPSPPPGPEIGGSTPEIRSEELV